MVRTEFLDYFEIEHHRDRPSVSEAPEGLEKSDAIASSAAVAPARDTTDDLIFYPVYSDDVVPEEVHGCSLCRNLYVPHIDSFEFTGPNVCRMRDDLIVSDDDMGKQNNCTMLEEM